jgi:hypothetical protein
MGECSVWISKRLVNIVLKRQTMMRIYLLPSQLPELKHLPKEAQEEVVETALYSIPITSQGLLSFACVVFPVVFAGLALAINFGLWIKYLYLLVGIPLVWVWWLNVARPRIRELAKQIARKNGESCY